MKGPAVEKTEATLAEIKALLDELLECTAECARLGNPLAKESTAEIRDRWRRETAEQAPAFLSGVRPAAVDLTAADAGVIGAMPTRCSTTSPRGAAHEAVGCLVADHEEFGVPLSSSETPIMRTAHQMLDGMPLPDNVLTHVGVISFFFELGLEKPSGVACDKDARQCLTLLLGSGHLLFVHGTYDATPQEWPLQDHNKMWQLFGELPPWGRSGFSPGDGIKSIYHVFGKWSPWIHSASRPKRSALQVSMMFCAKVSSWQISGFSPGHSEQPHFGIGSHVHTSWHVAEFGKVTQGLFILRGEAWARASSHALVVVSCYYSISSSLAVLPASPDSVIAATRYACQRTPKNVPMPQLFCSHHWTKSYPREFLVAICKAGDACYCKHGHIPDLNQMMFSTVCHCWPNGGRNYLYQLLGHNLSLTTQQQLHMIGVVDPRKEQDCSNSAMTATSMRANASMQVLVANGCWLRRPWDPGVSSCACTSEPCASASVSIRCAKAGATT